MEKMVHIWKVHCNKCGADFEHVFRARDILKPHIFNELTMKCPKCGNTSFDTVVPVSKMTLSQWELQHPELKLEDLPDYSYVEDND